MRTGVGVLGVLVLLIGAVFTGQGLGYIKGSFMTGDMSWFWIGLVMIVGGLVLGFVGFMRRPTRV
jgi:polyferredoxin